MNAKEKLLNQHIEALEENTDRVNILADHLKNVEQEQLHTQALVDAKMKEIKTETHLRQLAAREAGRMKADITKIDKHMLETQDMINSVQNAMVLSNEKLEQFKLQMNWNEEELLQWSLAAKQKNEDRQALEKYEAMDKSKIKNLTLKVEKATRMVQENKMTLEAEVTDAQAIQIELDKTAEEYRKLHFDKQHMIRQWSDAKIAMQRRDEAIARAAEEIVNVKVQLRERKRICHEQKDFLEQEQIANKQLIVSLGGVDRAVEKSREINNTMKREVDEFQAEVSAQRNELEKAESELRAANTMNENLHQLHLEKSERLGEFKELLEATKKTLENDYIRTDTLADKANQIDELYKQHVDRLAQMNKALQNLKENMFKHSHELFNLRKKEADLIAEISGAQGTSRNLQARIHEHDQRSLKQQEMLYNIEFQVQQLERKVSFASGKRSLEETLELKASIALLQKQLEELQQQHNMITNQVKRLHDDLRAARRKHKTILKDKADLSEKINEINLENDSATTEVKQSIKKKEEMIVKHDVLKLEVKTLRDTLKQIAETVFGLENRKLQLQLSMKEREKEVSLHRDIQRAEKKALEDQRHKLAMDLKERQIKVTKLQRKYETLAAKLRKADEEEHSQAYYIIQAAQAREELQREGDELNRSIRLTEKEIRMLTRTLEHLNTRNTNYRKGFQKADLKGADAVLKRDLEAQHRSVTDSLYKQKSYLREITADFEQRRKVLAELFNNIGGIHSEVNHKSQELESLRKGLEDQKVEVERSREVMLKKQHEYRHVNNLQDDEQTTDELFMDLLEQKRTNQTIMNLLQNFVEEHPEIRDSVDDVMEEMGLTSETPRVAGGPGAAPVHFPSINKPVMGTPNVKRSRPNSRGQYARGSTPKLPHP